MIEHACSNTFQTSSELLLLTRAGFTVQTVTVLTRAGLDHVLSPRQSRSVFIILHSLSI